MHPNFLSVAKFTKDHFVSFTPCGFLVKDLRTGKIWLQGQCEGDLYPIKPTTATIQPKTGPFSALSASSVSGDLWHHRLGHPSFFFLRLLISNKFLDLPARISSTSFCKDCAMGKSTQQPFSIVDRRAHVPFYLVHSDVWMYPISFLSSFRYYVMFTDDCTRYSWIYAT